MTASDEEKIQEDRDRLEFTELDEAVGFCKVIHKISESKKIVVGHNMFLDILYTLQQFVAPLPEDYDEFKVNILFLNLGAKNTTSCLYTFIYHNFCLLHF